MPYIPIAKARGFTANLVKSHPILLLTAFHEYDIMQSIIGGAGVYPCLTPTCRHSEIYLQRKITRLQREILLLWVYEKPS